MLVDLVNEVQTSIGLSPAVITDTSQGTAVDFSNGEISTQAIIKCGVRSAGTTTLTIQIEESTATNTGFTLIPGMSATLTTSNTLVVVRGLRTNRYVRANAVTVTGTTPSAAVDVVILAQKKYSAGSGVSNAGYSRSPST